MKRLLYTTLAFILLGSFSFAQEEKKMMLKKNRKKIKIYQLKQIDFLNLILIQVLGFHSMLARMVVL